MTNLTTMSLERDDFVKARQHWKEHQDAHTALKLFPKSCMAERAILSFFKKTGRSNDYYGALEAVSHASKYTR